MSVDRKQEAFENWVLGKGLNVSCVRHPLSEDVYLDDKLEMAWQAYQQAYEDMFPVFDRIEEVINKGGSIYEPFFDGSDDHFEYWEIIDFNKDVIATGKTFRELCVNFMMADNETKAD